MARRVRRRFRGGRVVDLACGHGLLGQILLLLDSSSPQALAVDRKIPASAVTLATALQEDWPRLTGQVQFVEESIESMDFTSEDLLVSAHACGSLTDLVLEQAVAVGARVAVLPCCHDVDRSSTGGLQGWMDGSLAIDSTRVARLRCAGYRVYTQTIPAEISPKNRLLLAEPEQRRFTV